MRSKDYGLILAISSSFNRKISLELFRRICLCRFFELKLKEIYDRGSLIKMPIYLSLGQESIAAALSVAFPEAKQFGQHRCHDLYLCYGGDINKLVDELLHRPMGCAQGMGGSASIHSPETGMFGHDGFMGSQVPVAVGYAHGSGNPTLCIMGDASAEEGYVLGALGEAATKKAPVLFVCADNDLSIRTKKEVRRSWSMVKVAEAKGITAIEFTDDPWSIMHHVHRLKDSLPAFLNILTCRALWHAGTGNDGEPEWNRFELIKKEMVGLDLAEEMKEIEKETENFVNEVWRQKLEAQ